MINFFMMTIGAFIGMMLSALLQINKLNDEKEAAYKRGYAKGMSDGKKKPQIFM